MKVRNLFLTILSILLSFNLFAENHSTGSTDITLDFLDSIPGFYDVFGSVTQFGGE